MACPKYLVSAAALFCAASAADVSAHVCYSEVKRNISQYSTQRSAVMYAELENFRERRVVGADPETFRSFKRDPCFAGYARDKSAVYYEGVKVPGADPQSFEPVADPYAKDRAWWYGAGVRLAGRAGGDLQMLSVGYAAHPEGVFYGARRVERDGFEVLGDRGYARSRNRVYFRGEEIPGIDVASFSVFPTAKSIARDKRSVVVMGRVDNRLDAGSFEVLTPDAGLAKDRNHVYSHLESVIGADPARVAWIGRGFWRDGKSLYFGAKAIAGADPESFRFVGGPGGSYAVDRRQVYLNGAPLAGVDPASFQVINFGYAKDRNGLYHYGRPLPGADPGSFSVRIDGRGRDKSYGYEYDKRVCAWTMEAAARLPMCDPARYGR